jgi:hypothetical protein
MFCEECNTILQVQEMLGECKYIRTSCKYIRTSCARGSAVDWGTALLTRRSQVRLTHRRLSLIDYMDFLQRSQWKVYQRPCRRRPTGRYLEILKSPWYFVTPCKWPLPHGATGKGAHTQRLCLMTVPIFSLSFLICLDSYSSEKITTLCTWLKSKKDI